MKKCERLLSILPAWGKIGLVLLATCIVYANSLNNPFHYDDFHSIVDNPHLRSWKNIPIFFTNPVAFSVFPENAMYRPFLLVTYCLNYLIHGYEPFGYHLVNLGLHLGCILFLWGLSRQYLGRTEGAWIAVVFFAVHPINSENINYISSRSEILSGFFFLGSLWCYGCVSISRRLRILLVCAGYILALLTKSISITLPLVIFTVDLFLKRSIFTEKWVKLGLVLIGSIYLLGIRNWILRATVDDPVRSFSEQFWTQIKALVFYVKMLIWPSSQNVDHQFLISDNLFDPISLSALFFLISMAIWLFRQRHKFPLLIMCGGCFFITLSPSVIVPLNVLVNEHRMYLPSVFFSLIIGWCWNRYINKYGNRLNFIHLLVLIACIGLATSTIRRNLVWNSSLSLWKDSSQKAPLMARPHIFWGEALENSGYYKKAISVYDHAIKRDPNHVPLYSRMGRLFREIGDHASSKRFFELGLQLNPVSGEMWSDYAETLREQELWDEVLKAYQRAVELRPNDDGLHNNLGNTYQVLNRSDEAILHHKIALKINSGDARTWVNLGNSYMMQSLYDSSLMAFKKAVKIDQSYLGGWLSMANYFETVGDKEMAINMYMRALELDSDLITFVEQRIKVLNEDKNIEE